MAWRRPMIVSLLVYRRLYASLGLNELIDTSTDHLHHGYTQ